MNALLEWLLAYALGSVSGSLLLGRLKGVDVRQHGSGNAGGTNALRTVGPWFALGVVVIDVGKGALAAGGIPGLLGADPSLRQALACGFAAVFGHCYPVWHGFRGGKGAATAIGAIAVLLPAFVVVMLITWLIVLAVTGYVGLATIAAGISLVPAALASEAPAAVVTFCAVIAGFIVFTHRSNIVNLARGSEHRFERARWQNWRRR